MATGSVLLALAMVAADGPSCPTVETTTYHVRVLTLDGLDWRTSSYSRLQPVARQGTSMIWTADRALAASLIDRAKGESPCHTIMAVGEAVLTKAESVNFVAAMDRVADGPVNQSSAIAFMPRPEQVEERFSIKVEGRKLDQGILTKIVLEETHVDVIHGVSQSETLVPPAAKSSKFQAELNRETLNVIQTAMPTVPQATSITSSVQIPEVTRASVAGEWLIPKDGVLLVSLGVKTAADDKGMAVVRERVAVVEACDTRDLGVNKMITGSQVAPFQHTKLTAPIVPGRSMPEAVDPDGQVVDLPPLPEALASADLDRIKPEPNQPSPQAPVPSAPPADPALARTSFDAAPPAPKGPMTFTMPEAQARSIMPKKTLDALAKAGVEGVEVDFEIMEGPKSPKETFTFELQGADLEMLSAMIKAGVKLDTPVQFDANHVVVAPKELVGLKFGNKRSELSENKAGLKPKCMAQADVLVGEVGEDINIDLQPKDLAVAVLKAGDDVEWGDVIVAMIKAGVKFETAPFLNPKSFVPAKAACEKCDGDSVYCPANARSMKASQVAGGIRVVPDPLPDSLRSSMNFESLGQQVRDLATILKSEDYKDVALKLLGRTETTVVPIDGQFSLEIKATVVPASVEKVSAAKKVESPTTRR